MTALLTIGTSTDRINLLDPKGFMLYEWNPLAVDHLGTWQSSPFGDGRRQVDFANQNTVDTFELKLRQTSQDTAIWATQQLRRMLRAAINYWKPPDTWTITGGGYDEDTEEYVIASPQGPSPVYLAARGSLETNTRYALVYDARLPTDDNPYTQPLAGISCQGAVMDNLSLIVEHGPWLANAPGSSACVQISGQQDYNTPGKVLWSGSPTAQDDDGYLQLYQSSAQLDSAVLAIGKHPAGADVSVITAVRFPNVTIPRGAIIQTAYIDFEAAASDSDLTRVVIYGNDTDHATQFEDGDDIPSRDLTSAAVEWPPFDPTGANLTIEPWTAGNTYNTPDLTTIVQEIINRDGWFQGNAMAFLMHDSGTGTGGGRRADSFDGAPTAPVLYITYNSTTYPFGRTETCDNEVYVANKANISNITNVYQYQGAAWSGNLLGTYNYDLFSAGGLANGDTVYFGVDSTLDDSGPFCSLVFDLNTSLQYSASAYLEWEYYNLSETDNTAGRQGSLSVDGVNSIHWNLPTNWATVNLFTLLGVGAPNVTGWWVRARAVIGGGDAIVGAAEQVDRDVYTITWPYITIASDQVAGDLDALGQILVQGWSASIEGYSIDPDNRAADRLWVGLRSVNRGQNFRAYLNWSDEQNLPGIIVQEGDDTTFTADSTAPTGRLMRYNPTANAETLAAIMEIYPIQAFEYYGIYRLFLRCQHNLGVADEFSVRVVIQSGHSGLEHQTDLLIVEDTSEFHLLDFGRVAIPPNPVLAGTEKVGPVTILVYVATDAFASAGTLDLIDVILMPADEWFGEFVAPGPVKGSWVNEMGNLRTLQIDSVGNPKRSIRAPLMEFRNSYPDERDLLRFVESVWICRSSGACTLSPNEQQRLWFLASNGVTSEPEFASSIRVNANQRYFSMRGNR